MHIGGGPLNLVVLGLEPSAAGHSVGMAQVSLMLTVRIFTTSLGLPSWVPAMPTSSMAFTTSRPWVTWPKSEYCGGRLVPASPATMKNWLPLVLAPELAMARDPSLYDPALGSSSSNLYPGPPVPVCWGSPPWMTKPGTIR